MASVVNHERLDVCIPPLPWPCLHAAPNVSHFAGDIRLRDYMASVMNHECVNVCITGCDSVCGLQLSTFLGSRTAGHDACISRNASGSLASLHSFV